MFEDRPPRWKLAALDAYYRATLAYRAWSNRRRAAAGRAPVMVLFYHRIADKYPNGWTASNRVFAQQITWLRRHFELVSLAEAQRRIASPGNYRPCVSITFDDGYAENCQQALPLLLREGIPFTYFVATQHILTGEPFSHDLARGVPLATNTVAQIRELAEAGVEIGVHTRHHANIGKITDPAELYDEVVTAREELEGITLKPARYFAFPFGHPANLSNEAFALARACGYAGVCSAYGGYNFAGDDPFHIQRIHADDDLLRLKNWVTVDPRKLRGTVRFVPRDVPITMPGKLLPQPESLLADSGYALLLPDLVDHSTLAAPAAGVAL